MTTDERADVAPPRERRFALRPPIAVVAVLVYAGLVAKVVLSAGGLPAARDIVIPLVLGGLAAASITSVTRLRSLAFGVAVEWLPFAFTLWLYDLVRGHADGLLFDANLYPQLDADRWLGRGTVPSVYLQSRLWHDSRRLHWWDYAAWSTYMSYFFVPTIVLAALWWWSRPLFRRLAAMVVLLAVAGCTTYVLFPAEPPWMAASKGALPPVHRLIGLINSHIPLVSFDALWEKGTRYSNNVAAVPSLHAGFTLLVTLFLVRHLRTPLRFLLLLYPPAMAFALVYSGEHYLVDVLLGWVYGAAAFAVVETVAQVRGRRRVAS